MRVNAHSVTLLVKLATLQISTSIYLHASRILDCIYGSKPFVPPIVFSMCTPRATSPRLLDLPAELRNLIYQPIVCGETHIKISPEGFIPPPPLATVSKQVRHELLPIWEGNTFTAISQINAVLINNNFNPLLNTLQKIPKETEIPLHTKLEHVLPDRDHYNRILPWLSYCVKSCPYAFRALHQVEIDSKQSNKLTLLRWARLLSDPFGTRWDDCTDCYYKTLAISHAIRASLLEEKKTGYW